MARSFCSSHLHGLLVNHHLCLQVTGRTDTCEGEETHNSAQAQGLEPNLEISLVTCTLVGLTNNDLAGYHIPVNADVPHVEALTVHEDDEFVNALGIKGVGELGVTGTVGAIANAVWHATGIRPTRFPIHPESLI